VDNAAAFREKPARRDLERADARVAGAKTKLKGCEGMTTLCTHHERRLLR